MLNLPLGRLAFALALSFGLSASGCLPSSDGENPAPTPSLCPSDLPGPKLVAAVVPTGVPGYCIDETEVTQAQYAAFLADTGGVSPSQGDRCQWNEDLGPKAGVGSCPAGSYDPDLFGDLPVSCVDWCDADAYCRWAGKRLCGRIGGGGLSNENFEPWDEGVSQWYNACSDGGRLVFPYGDRYEEGRCNGPEAERDGPWEVGSEGACSGLFAPYDGVFDMSGNVAEWEDTCSTAEGGGARDVCYVRGGAFSTPNDVESSPENDNTLGCLGRITGYERTISDLDWVGIRCCAD